MSKKQNKKHARKKAEQERNKDIDQYLLETQYPQECYELLKVDNNLSNEEQDIAERVRDHQPITDEEFLIIGEILGRWRGALHENIPSELEENANNIIREINSEKELLDLLDQRQAKTIKYKYPIGEAEDSKEQEYVIINLIIKPVDDSRAVESVQQHLQMFQDIPDNQRFVYEKAQRGEPISPEEAQIIRSVNKKLEEKGRKEDIAQEMNTFLAYNVDVKDSVLTNYDDKKRFWQRLSFMPKMALYLRVRDTLGLTETLNDDIYFLN